LVAVVIGVVALAGIVATAALVLARNRAAREFDPSRLPGPTREAYRAAEEHRDLFIHLPCYCGCAVLAAPHRHLLDCFLKPSGGYDSHAASCSTCVDIALEAIRAGAAGKSHAEVRALVDELFSGRGLGTATEYP
jgi:hypothetical protein